MAAVAMAESGGMTNNLNNNPGTGDYSVGLWQINYYNGMLAGRTKEYGAPATLAEDPNAQAKAAISLFGTNGSGLSNWQGDSAIKAWKAHGAPQQPSQATIGTWGTSMGGAGSGGTLTAATAAASPNQGCSSTGGINLDAASSIPVVGSILPSVTIGNQCQMKALTGGLMVGGGFIILVLGALMIAGKSASGTRAGKAAVGYVTGGPAGALAGASTGAQPVVGRTTRTGSQSDEAAQVADERKADRATARLAKQQETDARVAESVRQGREARAHSGRRVPASSSGPAF
jgi:hypothetical protein